MVGNVRRKFGTILVLSAVGGSSAALAGGFHVQEQNAPGVGRAQAGNAAVADDASTAYFNPAGLTELDGLQVSNGLDVIVPSIKMTDTGSTTRSTGAFLARPASGGFSTPGGNNGGNPGSATLIPDIAFSVPIPDLPLTFGLTVNAPFGFATKYAEGSFARYDSIDTFLFTLDVAPTLALKVNDWLSVGGGLDEQYAYVKLRSALPNPLLPGGPTPASDGRKTLSGHTWSTGFNLGLLVKPTPDTKLGLSYRYGITHDIKGTATVSGLTGPLAAGNGQFGATAVLDLPDMIDFALAQRITPDLTLLAEIDYIKWSNFKSIDVKLVTGTEDLTPENYVDTWSPSIGGEYRLTETLKLRAGFKYDPTPTTDAYRDTRVPDSDRYWVSGGFRYEVTDDMGFNFGYSHIFVTDSAINLTRSFYVGAPFPVPTSAAVKAQSQIGFDLISLGLTSRF